MHTCHLESILVFVGLLKASQHILAATISFTRTHRGRERKREQKKGMF